MKKLAILLLGVLLVCTACGSKKSKAVEIAPQPLTPQERITEYVQALTSEEMTGRRTGTRGEALAALYLAKHLQKLKVEPAGLEETYFQSFHIGEISWQIANNRMTLRHNPGTAGVQSANVLGIIPGRSDEIVILSAHYDHLGVIENELYPGANDNASGTALVMELAAALISERPRYTVLTAFWGGEEAGLLGSNYFPQYMTVPKRRVKAVVNLDSLGNLSEKKLLGWRSGEDEQTERFISSLLQAGWEITWENTTKHSSDHAAFGRAGIPGFTLLSPDWLDDNHTSKDTAKKLNYDLLTELMHDLKKVLI